MESQEDPALEALVDYKDSFVHYLRHEAFQLNFYRIHVAYFVVTIILSSVIMYAEGLANDPTEIHGTTQLHYIDAIFMSTSAMTASGLNVVNLGDLTAFQQAVLFLLMPLGSVIFVSLSIVYVRYTYFQRRFHTIATQYSAKRRAAPKHNEGISIGTKEGSTALDGAFDQHLSPAPEEDDSNALSPARRTQIRIIDARPMNHLMTRDRGGGVRSRRGSVAAAQLQSPRTLGLNSQSSTLSRSLTSSTAHSQMSRPARRRSHHNYGFGSYPTPWESLTVRRLVSWPFRKMIPPTRYDSAAMKSYLSFEPTLDARGRPHMLTHEQREELGGVEYRALRVLGVVLVFYQVFWYAVGTACLCAYAYRRDVADLIRTSQPGNLHPGWWGVFATFTSFTNCGLNLLDDSFESMYNVYFLLIVTMILTIVGNTQFPILLRMTIWLLSKLAPPTSRLREPLDFLLHHPRRCFIYLFPATETWILFFTQVALDLIEWVLFELLNLGLPYLESFSPGDRAIDGLFQAVALRTSGAVVVDLAAVAPGLLVAYVVAMYIASVPTMMTMRSTNAYEERSIGLDRAEGAQGHSGLGVHLRHQLAYDVWFLGLAWFLVCVIERAPLMAAAPGYSVFALLFEIVSAYGTVGLSLGVPGLDYSLSGEFHTLSKLVMMAVMLRGRHRGLPLAIDRSIMLPSERMRVLDDAFNGGTGSWSSAVESLPGSDKDGAGAGQGAGNSDEALE